MTIPIISNVSPAAGSSLVPNAPWSFDVTDPDGLKRVIVMCKLRSDVFVVHDGDAFTDRFSGSTRTAIANGFRFQILHRGGWREAPEFSVIGYDVNGNETIGGTLDEQLVVAVPDLVMNLEAHRNVTLSGSLVDTWVDTVNGYTFTGTGAARHTYQASGWSDGTPKILGSNNTTWMGAPDNNDFSVGSDSWLVVAAIDLDAISAYETWFGNGHSANDEGFRCFTTASNTLQVYMGPDAGPGTAASSYTVSLGENVVAWCVDQVAGVTKYGVHGTGVQNGLLTDTSVTDNGNQMTIGGGFGSTAYRPPGSWKSVSMWKRPAAQGFSNDEITNAMSLVAGAAGL